MRLWHYAAMTTFGILAATTLAFTLMAYLGSDWGEDVALVGLGLGVAAFAATCMLAVA